MTQEQKQDYTRRITRANKTQLITILYDMTVDYLTDGCSCFENGDTEGFDRELSRADACIDELICSLDTEYELGRNLLSLYIFEKGQLRNSRVKRETGGAKQAIGIFTRFRDTYRQFEAEDKSDPVMVNVPEVYAGMTYGRGSLTENVSSDYTNRGFKA